MRPFTEQAYGVATVYVGKQVRAGGGGLQKMHKDEKDHPPNLSHKGNEDRLHFKWIWRNLKRKCSIHFPTKLFNMPEKDRVLQT